MKRLATLAAALCASGLLAACANVGIGLSLPIPGIGSIGVGGTSDGRVSGGVSVGSGPVRVGVGASGRLPSADPAAPAASAASAPAPKQATSR